MISFIECRIHIRLCFCSAKVKEEKESAGECDDVARYYCDLVDKILMAGHSLGKDGRFQLFVCLGAR